MSHHLQINIALNNGFSEKKRVVATSILNDRFFIPIYHFDIIGLKVNVDDWFQWNFFSSFHSQTIALEIDNHYDSG